MNQITQGPKSTDAGLHFNYSAWTADTVVTLANVPWNADYRDIVKFETPQNPQTLNQYIAALSTAKLQITDLSYAKPYRPVRLNLPKNVVEQFNYLRASNKAQPVPGNDTAKEFYYFITAVNYISPNTTEIVLQLDVWQTFGKLVQFGNCYIERGHIGIANSKAFDNNGRDYLSLPEGLDVGSAYQVATVRRDKFMQTRYTGGGIGHDVLVMSATDLNAEAGTVDDPKLETARGSAAFGLVGGAQLLVFNGQDSSFSVFMGAFASKPWVTQGIMSITLIPRVARYYANFAYNPEGASGGTKPPQTPPPRRDIPLFPGWRNSAEIMNSIPARYRHLRKLWTSPYMFIEMTTWSGNQVMIRPEHWKDDNATVIERVSFVPPAQRVEFRPHRYNTLNTNAGINDDNGEYLDVMTQIGSFPTMSIVNNMAIGVLASNAHSNAFGFQSADWSQQRALFGNEVAYDQATVNASATAESGRLGRNQANAAHLIGNRQAASQALLEAISSVAGGGAGGAINGGAKAGAAGAVAGLAGAAAGAASTAMSLGYGNEQRNLQNSTDVAQNALSVGQQEWMRDSNKNLADYAARGDYQNTIAGQNARIQDAALTQPSVSGQVGGETMNLVNDSMEVSLRWKIMDAASMRAVGEYWLRYGYAVRQFAKPPASLMCMSNFTYWKMTETYIKAAPMPETFKQTIRGIFEKGVTVWADPNDIGMIDMADNTPLGGITL